MASHHLAITPPAVAEPLQFLSPGPAADAILLRCGIDSGRIARWEPGVDAESFNPARYTPDALPDGFTVLYAGPLAPEHGLDLLADALLIARERNVRLRLAVAGEGPAEAALRRRLGAALTVLGPITDRLARAYATADLLVAPSELDLFGQSVIEAQASGLPVVAVDAGAAAEFPGLPAEDALRRVETGLRLRHGDADRRPPRRFRCPVSSRDARGPAPPGRRR